MPNQLRLLLVWACICHPKCYIFHHTSCRYSSSVMLEGKGAERHLFIASKNLRKWVRSGRLNVFLFWLSQLKGLIKLSHTYCPIYRTLKGTLILVAWINFFNPFFPSATFPYALKTSENRKVFCFKGVEKGCIGNKWVNRFWTAVINQALNSWWLNCFLWICAGVRRKIIICENKSAPQNL